MVGRLFTKDELKIVSGGEDEIIVTGTQAGSGGTSGGGTFVGGGAPSSPGDVISNHQDAPPDENEEQMDEIIVQAQTQLDNAHIISFPVGNNTVRSVMATPDTLTPFPIDIDSPFFEESEDALENFLELDGRDYGVEFNQVTGVFHYWINNGDDVA